ncbi:MAG: hypothetical protein OXT65_01785 [Alphaproteobacteria bacterium]|nr:hypothetical protein [Alphaproteobacteria bacterium]
MRVSLSFYFKNYVSSSNKGNALFLILIAVALFAAVSYAVTQSGRGSGNIDRETATLDAAMLVQYAASIQQAMQRMRLVNGTTDAEFSFYSPDWGDNQYIHGTPQPAENRVFSPGDGGVPFRPAGDFGASYFLFTGQNAVAGLGACADNSASTCKELLLLLVGVPDAVCSAINRALIGTSAIPGDGIAANNTAGNKFTGSYGTSTSISYYISTGLFVEKNSGCLLDAGLNVFYHALVER